MQLFRATTETILTYGSSTWTLTKRDEGRLDGTYTRMLRQVHNISWRDKINNNQLYGPLKKISQEIRLRRLRLAGHCHRDTSSPGHALVTWKPRHGTRNRGRHHLTFLDNLCDDVGADSVPEVKRLMSNKNEWRLLVARSSGSDKK